MSYETRNRLTVDGVLVCLAKNPYRHLIRRWNWKSACISALLRGIVIFLANISAGGLSAVGAMTAEVCYRGMTSGFYSALTQAFRFAQPVWAASAVPMVLIPLIGDSCEFAMHGMRGTQRLGTTMAVSMIFTAVSVLFELFAMRRGIFVMGQNSRPFVQDLKSLPKLALDFGNEIKNRFLSGSVLTRRRKMGQGKKPGVLSAFGECEPINAAKPLE